MRWQLLDSLSYQNQLRHLSPEHKLLLGIILLLLVIIGHPLVQGMVFIWMALWVLLYARIPLRPFLLFLLLPLAFFAAGMPALLIDVRPLGAEVRQVNDPVLWWTLGNYLFTVSTEAIRQVSALFCRTLASLACFAFILFTTPFSEILQVMRRIGMPALVTDLLMIMYRFIFILLETSAQLWQAQRSRGGHQGFRASIRDAGGLVTQLFIRSMRRYEMLQWGMAARGMAEHFQVQGFGTHTRSLRHVWESVIGCLVLIGLECLMGGWLF